MSRAQQENIVAALKNDNTKTELAEKLAFAYNSLSISEERVRELDGELITSRRYWEKQCVSLVDRVRELEDVLRSCCNVLEANNFKGPGGAYDRAIQVLMEEADGE